jgi:hypothetical protein
LIRQRLKFSDLVPLVLFLEMAFYPMCSQIEGKISAHFIKRALGFLKNLNRTYAGSKLVSHGKNRIFA